MIGQSQIVVGVLIIFISVFLLFYIFNGLQTLADECNSGSTSMICSQMTSFSVPMLIILLIISGFVIIVSTTTYIILSP